MKILDVNEKVVQNHILPIPLPSKQIHRQIFTINNDINLVVE